MAKFLFELLTEEIPSSLQLQAQKDMESLFKDICNERGIVFSSINVFSTPRRLTVFLDGCIEQIPDKVEEKKGPRVDANSKAIDGFLKTYSLKLEDCIKKDTSKGEFYFYQKITKGGKVKTIMVNVILNVLQKMKFKKSMKWNDTKVYWARPIRGLLSFFDDEVLDFSFAGVSSANTTKGHRFLGKQNIVVESISNYFEELKNNFVVLDAVERKNIILEKVQKISKQYDVDYYFNESLFEEICYLVEYPEVLVAEIPQKYMFLPKELLIEIIVKNQRYINLISKDSSLYNKYVIVSNLKSTDKGETIIAGNNKVLQARLEDGLFFYNNDLKLSLKDKAKKLKNINFFEGLGSIYDKTQRVKKLFGDIFKEDQSELCDIYKSDLCSEVVFEIPELQGIMGYYYAKSENVVEEIALAIKNQYKPQGPSDSLPENLLGAKLAFLDKLDTLIGFFNIGKKPSGSKDPFALRRSAIGIIRIIEQFELDVDLSHYISSDLREFLAERIEVYLSSEYSVEVIKNNLKQLKTNEFNILSVIVAIKQIDSLLKTEEGIKLTALHKRVSNILRSQKISTFEINESFFTNSLEQDLFEIFKEIQKDISFDISQNVKNIAKLKNPLDAFLDNIQINDSESVEIKNNRIKLLELILSMCDNVLKF